MSNSFLTVLTVAMLAPASLLAQSNGTQPVSSANCGCPIPVYDTEPHYDVLPLHADEFEVPSPDGKYLAYLDMEGDVGIYVLNLQTLETKMLAGDGYHPAWAPYGDILAFTTDAIVNGEYGLFTYNALTGDINDITPPRTTTSLFSGLGNGFSVNHPWLRGSEQGNDSIWINMTVPDSLVLGIYLPETRKFIPMRSIWDSVDYYRPANTIYYDSILESSKDSEHTFLRVYKVVVQHADLDTQFFYLDGEPFRVPRPATIYTGSSFSPDGRLLALSVVPQRDSAAYGAEGDTLFPQVWIYDVQHPSPDSVLVINLQCSFCMYAFVTPSAEFLTDSTLAVGMAPDWVVGDNWPWIVPLWEVTLDGRLVRQLTWLTSSSVAENDNVLTNPFVLNNYPDPIASQTTISFTLSEAGSVKLIVTDLAGHETPILESAWMDAGPHEVTWDASKFPSGVYLCRLAAGGENVTRRVVVMH